MTCQPKALQSGVLEEAVGQRCTEVGASYHGQLRRRIRCLECSVELTNGSMTAHQIRMHGSEPEIDWNRLPVLQTEHLPQVYDVIFPKGIK